MQSVNLAQELWSPAARMAAMLTFKNMIPEYTTFSTQLKILICMEPPCTLQFQWLKLLVLHWTLVPLVLIIIVSSSSAILSTLFQNLCCCCCADLMGRIFQSERQWTSFFVCGTRRRCRRVQYLEILTCIEVAHRTFCIGKTCVIIIITVDIVATAC